jgi:hypothetical protein
MAARGQGFKSLSSTTRHVAFPQLSGGGPPEPGLPCRLTAESRLSAIPPLNRRHGAGSRRATSSWACGRPSPKRRRCPPAIAACADGTGDQVEHRTWPLHRKCGHLSKRIGGAAFKAGRVCEADRLDLTCVLAEPLRPYVLFGHPAGVTAEGAASVLGWRYHHLLGVAPAAVILVECPMRYFPFWAATGCQQLVSNPASLNFRSYAAAFSQARRMAWISSGVGWSG